MSASTPSSAPRLGRKPTKSSQVSQNDKVCQYYLQDKCRHGTACKFKHEKPAVSPSLAPAQPQSAPTPLEASTTSTPKKANNKSKKSAEPTPSQTAAVEIVESTKPAEVDVPSNIAPEEASAVASNDIELELVDDSTKADIVAEQVSLPASTTPPTDSSHVESNAVESSVVESSVVESSTDVKETAEAVVGRPRAQSVEIQNTAAALEKQLSHQQPRHSDSVAPRLASARRELARNLVRDSLKAGFEHRPALQQLEDAGLLAHGVQSKGVSARLQAAAMALSRSMLNDKLAQCFDRRASVEALLASNVLHNDPRQSSAVGPSLQATQQRLAKELMRKQLNASMLHRPPRDELEARHILLSAADEAIPHSDADSSDCSHSEFSYSEVDGVQDHVSQHDDESDRSEDNVSVNATRASSVRQNQSNHSDDSDPDEYTYDVDDDWIEVGNSGDDSEGTDLEHLKNDDDDVEQQQRDLDAFAQELFDNAKDQQQQEYLQHLQQQEHQQHEDQLAQQQLQDSELHPSERETIERVLAARESRLFSMTRTLLKVVAHLYSAGRISLEHRHQLKQFVIQQHPWLLAAAEVFEHDGDLDELADTLCRVCAQ